MMTNLLICDVDFSVIRIGSCVNVIEFLCLAHWSDWFNVMLTAPALLSSIYIVRFQVITYLKFNHQTKEQLPIQRLFTRLLSSMIFNRLRMPRFFLSRKQLRTKSLISGSCNNAEKQTYIHPAVQAGYRHLQSSPIECGMCGLSRSLIFLITGRALPFPSQQQAWRFSLQFATVTSFVWSVGQSASLSTVEIASCRNSLRHCKQNN